MTNTVFCLIFGIICILDWPLKIIRWPVSCSLMLGCITYKAFENGQGTAFVTLSTLFLFGYISRSIRARRDRLNRESLELYQELHDAQLKK